ncbi:MAG: ImmA/IrrE family metallo-endopeptidase [Candidatus Omnitrophica bacterium]|nr:ImmA/IrrE family metallo-endopeptidase [Candidatus Omnitrophota bacterium]
MAEAFEINPKIIRWALERCDLSLTEISKKVDVAVERMESWLSGEAHPTFNQIMKLANGLHIPYGYLFLSKPPKEELVLPDLRALRRSRSQKLSPEFHEVLDSALRKQDWYRDYLIAEGAGPLEFVGRFSMEDPIEEAANGIINVFGIDAEMRKQAKNWEQFLQNMIFRIEHGGVIVLRSRYAGNNTNRTLSVDEFRGFAISDKYAPFIFINGNDAKAAQIFTTVHELAHIMIHESGVSNLDLRRGTSPSSKIESFCNQAAAEVLVPKKLFYREWKQAADLNNNLSHLSRTFRVSNLVVLKRAYDLEKINREEYHEAYDRWAEDYKNREKKSTAKSRGGDFYRSLFVRNSPLLSSCIVSAALEGKLLYRDAASLFDSQNTTLITKAANELGFV